MRPERPAGPPRPPYKPTTPSLWLGQRGGRLPQPERDPVPDDLRRKIEVEARRWGAVS